MHVAHTRRPPWWNWSLLKARSAKKSWKVLDNNDLNQVWLTSGFVKTRVCWGCSVSQAHKAWSRPFLFKVFQKSFWSYRWRHWTKEGNLVLRVLSRASRKTPVSQKLCRYDIVALSRPQRSLPHPLLLSSWRGYLKMSTTPEKNSIAYCKRENARNEVGYLLGISCTSR